MNIELTPSRIQASYVVDKIDKQRQGIAALREKMTILPRLLALKLTCEHSRSVHHVQLTAKCQLS